MMSTWLELKTEIMDEYDLNEEVFISPTELMRAANAAIEDIEKNIHALDDQGSKYFHNDMSVPLVTAESYIALPTDIYANKVTGIFYNDGSTKYEIKPIMDLEEIQDIQPNDFYRYRIVSDSVNGMRVKIYPASRETSSANVTMFYRRKANRITGDSSVIDIPEGQAFIKQFVIDVAVNKERMTPNAPESAALSTRRQQLLDSLTNQIDDENNEVLVDYSHYDQSV